MFKINIAEVCFRKPYCHFINLTKRGVIISRNMLLDRTPIIKRNTRWFKYDWEYLCVNKSQFVPVIFELPGIYIVPTGLDLLLLVIH